LEEIDLDSSQSHFSPINDISESISSDINRTFASKHHLLFTVKNPQHIQSTSTSSQGVPASIEKNNNSTEIEQTNDGQNSILTRNDDIYDKVENILPWDTVQKLNWEVVFLLGGGFALSKVILFILA